MSPRLWPNDEGPPTRSQSEGQRHAFTNQEMESRPDALHPTAVFTPWWASSGHEPPFRAPGAPGHAQGPPEPSEASRAVIEGVVVFNQPGRQPEQACDHDGYGPEYCDWCDAESCCPRCCEQDCCERDGEEWCRCCKAGPGDCYCASECEPDECDSDDAWRERNEASDEDEEGDWFW